MKSIMLHGKKDIRLVETPIPSITEDEILLKVKAASICGSDVRMVQNGYGSVDENNPLTLGHEFAGVIEKVGSRVKGYETGMKVALAPNWGCGICDECVSGNTHLCDVYQAFGINKPGGFAEYVVLPEGPIRQGNVTVLGSGVSFEEAALIEPFSCVYNGQQMLDIKPGQTVLIIGAGPIGILHAWLVKAQGASYVFMHDLQAERLAMAKELMPDLIPITGDVLEDIKNKTNGKGVDICIIAAPAPSAQEQSLSYMNMNGKVLFFGGLPKAKENIALNSNTVHYRQIGIFGSARANISQYRTCLKLVESGRIPIAKLITSRFPIEAYQEAFTAATEAKGLKNCLIFD